MRARGVVLGRAALVCSDRSALVMGCHPYVGQAGPNRRIRAPPNAVAAQSHGPAAELWLTASPVVVAERQPAAVLREWRWSPVKIICGPLGEVHRALKGDYGARAQAVHGRRPPHTTSELDPPGSDDVHGRPRTAWARSPTELGGKGRGLGSFRSRPLMAGYDRRPEHTKTPGGRAAARSVRGLSGALAETSTPGRHWVRSRKRSYSSPVTLDLAKVDRGTG